MGIMLWQQANSLCGCAELRANGCATARHLPLRCGFSSAGLCTRALYHSASMRHLFRMAWPAVRRHIFHHAALAGGRAAGVA